MQLALPSEASCESLHEWPLALNGALFALFALSVLSHCAVVSLSLCLSHWCQAVDPVSVRVPKGAIIRS